MHFPAHTPLRTIYAHWRKRVLATSQRAKIASWEPRRAIPRASVGLQHLAFRLGAASSAPTVLESPAVQPTEIRSRPASRHKSAPARVQVPSLGPSVRTCESSSQPEQAVSSPALSPPVVHVSHLPDVRALDVIGERCHTPHPNRIYCQDLQLAPLIDDGCNAPRLRCYPIYMALPLSLA